MTVRHKNTVYKSGIQFKSPYFYSDRFKNSIARAFRGLETGKVSFTQVEEMYDLRKVKEDKQKKKDQKKEDKEKIRLKDQEEGKPVDLPENNIPPAEEYVPEENNPQQKFQWWREKK